MRIPRLGRDGVARFLSIPLQMTAPTPKSLTGTPPPVGASPALNDDCAAQQTLDEPLSVRPKPNTDADLRAGAIRLFATISEYDPGSLDRVVVKVPLPTDVLALARAVPVPPRAPGEAGRPSTARVLAQIAANALNSLPPEALWIAVSTDLPSPTTGIVNVDVDAASLAALSACAKRLQLTLPQMLGRLLAHELLNGPCPPRNDDRAAPETFDGPLPVKPGRRTCANLQATRRGGLGTVQALRMIAETATSALPDAVAQARAEGATWEQVGRVLGTTRQAAHERFGGLGAR